MKKEISRKWLINLVLVLGVALIAVVLALSAGGVRSRINPTAGMLPEENASAHEAEEVQAYLLITVGGRMYEPIPLQEGKRYTLKQGEKVNVIETTAASIVMASSTCENQDCVLQGVVDLENRNDRVLQNMILCLPHEVVLELCTPEEIAQRGIGGAQ